MLRADRETRVEEEAQRLQEELENKHLMEDIERDNKEAMRTGVTYRPARKPGEGPNIGRDGATYSRLINTKKYATFRKNIEKHDIQKKVGDRAGELVAKKKGPRLSQVASDARRVHIGDDEGAR